MKSSTPRFLSSFIMVGIINWSVMPAAFSEGSAPPDPANNTATSAASPAAITATEGHTQQPAAQPAPDAVVAGPLEPARKMLLERIQLAKGEGIGTSGYMMAFKALEDSVKSGQTAEQIKPGIERLAKALHEQLEKSKVLKTQRPTPPSSSQGSPGADNTPAGGALSNGGGKPDLGKLKDLLNKGGTGNIPPGLIEKLKEKLGGGNIPEGIKDQIPKDILDRLNK